MRNHTRLAAVLLLVVVGWVASAAAQQEALKNSTPDERAKMQTMMMREKLSLTPDQVPKVEAINLKYAEQMQPVINGTEGPLMKMRAAEKIVSAKEAELKQVLTPDQFPKYLAMKEEMRDKMKERMMQKMGGS